MKNLPLTAAVCLALAGALYFALPSKEYAAGFALLCMFFAAGAWTNLSGRHQKFAAPSKMQHDLDLTFCVKIELNIGQITFFDIINNSLAGSERNGGYIKYSKNVMTLELNTFRDAEKAKSGADAWLYYNYDLDVFPVEPVGLEHQKNLVRELVSIAETLNGVVEIIAEFEM